MNYHDLVRPRLANGRPSWLTAPLVALPSLVITPEPHCKYRIAFMINNSFKYLTINDTLLECTLIEWIDSPENFALNKFGVIPTASASISPQSAEEAYLAFGPHPKEAQTQATSEALK